MALGDETLDCEGELDEIWDRASPGSALYSFLQEFSWLRHLNALGVGGKAPARTLMKAWLERYEKWSPDAWEPATTAVRLVNLCCYAPLILEGTDALWRSRVLTSMARQTRHLARSAHRAQARYDRLMTALGLAIAGFCLPGCEKPAERGLELVRREIRLQMLPDGGHISRNPSRQLSIVLRLQTILRVMQARELSAPGYLRHAAARANAIVRLFRCADGRLAVFNGGVEDDGNAVTAAQSFDNDETAIGFARPYRISKAECGALTDYSRRCREDKRSRVQVSERRFISFFVRPQPHCRKLRQRSASECELAASYAAARRPFSDFF